MGLTIVCFYVCISGQGDVNAALCFTAMSRVRRLEDLAFYRSIPNHTYFQVNNSSKSLEARMKEEERKNALSSILLQQLATGQEPSCNAAAEAEDDN